MVRRRTFIEGLIGGGVLAASGTWARDTQGLPSAGAQTQLSGNDFALTAGARVVNFTGQPGIATVINGSLPAPILRWREGDTVTLRLNNELPEPTSIHWHGILLPASMDGVPGVSFRGVAPGESYVYRFRVRQSGTYWYHSHSGFQEQTGLYGPLIIDPREPEPFAYDREHVVLLSDWTDRDPLAIYRLLKKQSHYFNFNRRTVGDFIDDAERASFKSALQDRLAWGRMRMQPSDLADVSGYTYTYLMNGVTPAGNWTGLVRAGERVRLRFINGSAMTYFDVRIPGLPMTVVAADGQNVHPVTVDEFRLGVAETLDVIITPAGAEAFTLFAQSMDRSGFARGTLALREGLSAPVPEVDKIVYLTMADMGHGDTSHGGAEHTGGAAGTAAPVASQHDHGAADQSAAAAPEQGDASHAGDAAAGAVDHSMHTSAAPPASGSAALQTHPASEYKNPGVDMQTMHPAPRLADPGVGLRNNGRRVLTYADLHTFFPDPDGRAAGRDIELHLTGHMERYLWSFDGLRFSDAEPLRLQYGERVRLTLVNDTMMEHPIHLHGMWSDLEDEQGLFHLRKHTLSIPPGTRRSYRVTADALGPWAYHCHLLYHMEAGMFREVRVEE
jgi:CopA family copper-resistance protein